MTLRMLIPETTDTPWYCAGCGDEIKRGDEMLAFYDDGHRVEMHRECAARQRLESGDIGP